MGVTITGETLDGAPIALTEDDIIEGSFSIDRNWTSGSTLEIGCADTSELTFELDNFEGQWSDLRWEGARLRVVLDIDGEPLQAGIFTVDEPPRKLTTMQIRALDDMARFNRPYEPGIPYPATLKQILMDCCSQCGVTLYTLEFDNGDYVVAQRPEGDDITFHHVVAWVAELAGCNAWIDELARLRLDWYGESQAGGLEIGPDDRFSYEAAEADIEITGIIYRTDEVDYLIGDDRYALIIEGNPLLQDNHEAVLNVLFDRLGGFKYRPFRFEVLFYPHLWPGDKITKLIEPDGSEISSIITNHLLKLNGNSRIEARGETETVRGYATGAPFTPSQKRVLQAVAKIEAARQTSTLEQAVLRLNELMTNALGFYSTTVELETGAKITYTHDQPSLEESMIIWTMTEQGFAWTDQGWQGGQPTWQYGVTADGSIVAKLLDVVGVRAEWVHIGAGTTFDYGYDPSEKADRSDHDELSSIVSEHSSLLTVFSDEILLKADRTEVDELNQTVQQHSAQISTVADQVSIEVSRLEGEIGATSDELTMVKSHFDFTADGLRIRKPGSPMQVSISNEQIGLIDSGQLVAYINGQEMNITRAKVLQSLLVGTHVIEKYSDEITLIRWVG